MFSWFKRKKNIEEQLPVLAPAAPVVETPTAPVEVPAPKAVETPSFIMTQDGNITLTWHGKTHSIGKTHANYQRIVMCLTNREFDKLDSLVNIAETIEKSLKGVTVNQYGEVFYGNDQIHNVISTKIAEFMKTGLPYKPLARFLENLMQNPSERARNELYDFLTHGNFPITHDGCFMAYKGVTADFKDCHTKTFDNSIGSVNEMPRENVDPDTNVACSTGFHVGTHSYANEFKEGGKLMLVKVNPRDAVSVPRDHSCEKLRVCRYEVVDICERVITEPLFVQPGVPEEEYQDEPETSEDISGTEDICGACGCYSCICNDESNDDDWTDAGLGIETDPKPVTTPKRPACTYCGAKGGKKHDKKCKRPQKK